MPRYTTVPFKPLYHQYDGRNSRFTSFKSVLFQQFPKIFLHQKCATVSHIIKKPQFGIVNFLREENGYFMYSRSN